MLGTGDEVAVEVDGVTVAYNDFRALSDLTATFRSGTINGLIGPNGAGKTTLLNALSGVVRPSEGDIKLLGRSIVGMSPQAIWGAGVSRTYQKK